MISRCRAKACIVQLRESNQNLQIPTIQRGIKGHVIVYPQNPSKLESILPPAMEDVITPICVLFVGSSPPSREWLCAKAKPLLVRRERVRKALDWLKSHNPLYSEVVIDYERIASLDKEFLPPFHVEHIHENESADVLVARYDNVDIPTSTPADLERDGLLASDPEEVFQSVVITDVDVNAPAHELRAAALRHFKQKGKSFLQLPHDPKPVNEFNNPSLLPMIYPTLFPYGIGGPENPRRQVPLSFQRHVTSLQLLQVRRERF
ncbi:hypothetical protein BDQ17DRAFT_1500299 [Cyathus striatus]|nr:hypothetical protein BDQ17DRAFT_1500299 [Cyathus striatus]